ncbi:MAG: hypothetical protein Q9204_004009 [Flavoplaca sp. TL-2023a]
MSRNENVTNKPSPSPTPRPPAPGKSPRREIQQNSPTFGSPYSTSPTHPQHSQSHQLARRRFSRQDPSHPIKGDR